MTPNEAVDVLVSHFDSVFFAALAEPVRISIVREMLVLGEPADINTIAARVPQDRSVVSRHLNTLLQADIVSTYKEGRHRFYTLRGGALADRLEELARLTRRAMSVCCPPISCCGSTD